MKQSFLSMFFLLAFISMSGQGKLTDKRDGNVYRIININGVFWMGENLRYIPKEGAFYFDNNTNNIQDYGVLYEWKTAMKVCPAGWRLPSAAEFRKLANHFEQKESWGKIASDTTSFGIQLGGMLDYEGTFSEVGEGCYLWTSTEYDNNNSEYFSYVLINQTPVIDISRPEDITDMHGSEKSNKYSVRCVK
jgi:uncharacterized protein (TIGR02145 family)